MAVWWRRYWQAALALAAVLAMLVVFNATVIPGHWHDRQQGRSCDVCRSGHLPSPAPLLRVEIQSPAPVGWHRPVAELTPVLEPVSIPSSSRAPPA